MSARITVSLCLGGCLAVAGGCGSEGLPDEPNLPPAQSMSAELSAVQQAPAAAKAARPDGLTQYTNFANAWVRVKILQLYALGVVSIPAVVMAAALQQDPTRQNDKWVWDVTAGEASASLQIGGGLVSGWDVELFVTTKDVDSFLWVEGEFTGDTTSGSWLAHDAKLPSDNNAVLQINWAYTSETDYSLEYENVNQSAEEVGDSLKYTLSGNDAMVVFTDASDSDLVANIAWDATTGAGSIEVPEFNAGDKACWDDTFKNVDCP